MIIYLSGESARKIEELSKINAFIDHLNEEMPGLKLNKPAVQERIVVHILPERLALYKVNQNVLLNTLEKNISKVSIGKLNTGNLYIPIVITENEHTIRDILNEVYVSNSDRKYIPVAALTDLSMEYDYKKIFGKKEGVVVPVQVYHTGDSIQEIIKTVRTEAVKANLDPHFGGAYFEGNETFWQMLMIVIVALLMLYFILASQFESLTLPLIVLIEIPIDVAMTLLALWICGISLNLMSMIGIVVMSGIVINDSILKIDTIIRLQQQGFPLLEAIHEGGVRRLKPILMTSLSTVLGILPMAIATGAGAESRVAMGIAVVGGMVCATFLSLFVIPAIYSYLSTEKVNVIGEEHKE